MVVLEDGPEGSSVVGAEQSEKAAVEEMLSRSWVLIRYAATRDERRCCSR